LVEQTEDPGKCGELYGKIDNEILTFLEKIIDKRCEREDIIDVAVSSKISGGFELILPGIYYGIMRAW
jgi:hypothetical protein